MKKIIFSLVLLFAFLPIFSQNSIFVKGKDYKGYAFNKYFSPTWEVEDEVNNSSEMLEDIRIIDYIQKAERILKENKDAIKKESEEGFSLKGIYFDDYIRQYLVSTNKDGDTIVWMNMLKKNILPSTNLSKKFEIVLGGGNNFWSVYINITKESYYGLSVNGPF